MRAIFLAFLFSCLAFSCASLDSTSEIVDLELSTSVVPLPKTVDAFGGALKLSESSQVLPEGEVDKRIVNQWLVDLSAIHGSAPKFTTRQSSDVDLVFYLDTTMAQEAHEIRIDAIVQVRAGSNAAIAQACATLTQLSAIQDSNLVWPRVRILDQPDANYRGVMLDLARAWHSVDTIKQIIDLAALYKANMLHLHFTDYQSYTLPSKAFPKLSTPGQSYSYEDLQAIKSYASKKGLTVVPEIDIPGHAQAMVEAYPELFGISNLDKNPYIINMGKEEVYTALDTLIGELVEVFDETPYFHIGGDEAIFDHVLEDPDVQAYMKQKGLGEDVHELYRHFIVRLNTIVKSKGKQMCVWEGFRPEGEVEIPKDILVFEFETNRYLPQDLIADGYTVVNTAWKPLYVVNQKKFSPESIYNWNRWYWANWWPRAPSFKPIQTERSELVIGGQMCSWEQKAKVLLPSLRKRWPIAAERMWNDEKRVDLGTLKGYIKTPDAMLTSLTSDARQDDLLDGYDWVKPQE